MERARIPRVVSLLFAFTSLVSLVAANAVDFHYYPAASQDCLYQASNSSHCDPSSVPVYNGCVCSNGGGFLDSAASCLGSSDAGDLTTVYNTMNTNCGGSNTPIAYTLQKWLSAAGQGSSSSSSSAKPTTAEPSSTKVSTIVVTASATTGTPVVSTITLASSTGGSTAVVSVVTVTPGQSTVLTVPASAQSSSGGSSSNGGGSSNSGSGSSSKLSTGAIAGIAVGGAGAAAIAGGLLVWLCLRRRNSSPGGSVAEAQGPPTYGGPVPYGGAGGMAEAKPAHQSWVPPSQQPTPEPMKYTYANQQTGGQPMYGQPPQPNPGYSPQQPQYGQQAPSRDENFRLEIEALEDSAALVRIEFPRIKFFENAVEGNFKERNGEAELSHDDPHAVKAMLEFVYISDYTYDTVAFSDTVGELTLHARVYAIAGKYDVGALKLCAGEKFSWLEVSPSNLGPSWTADTFTSLAQAVYNLTPDTNRYLRDPLQQMAIDIIESLDSDDILRPVVSEVPEFRADVIDALVPFRANNLGVRCSYCHEIFVVKLLEDVDIRAIPVSTYCTHCGEQVEQPQHYYESMQKLCRRP